MKDHEVNVSVRVIPDNRPFPFHVPAVDSLLDVMQTGAQRADVTLLPNADAPLDLLHNIGKHQEPGPAITDLGQAVGDYVDADGHTNDFGIELVRAIRVNTRWAIAPKDMTSPHEILDLFQLNYQEYSLYRGNSADLLPLDTPIAISRGDAFEAQRDGKYGGIL